MKLAAAALVLVAAPALAQSPAPLVAEVANIRFYGDELMNLTGHTVGEALARRNIAYTPSVEELFGRARPQYRGPVTSAWAPYLQGRVTMDTAIANTVAALDAPK
jgi:hypothetical protein